GNHNVYVTVENSDGQVLALFRNTKFADFTEQDNAMSVEDRKAMVGNTIFLVNLVTYKVDIAEFRGQEIRFVIHDHASSGWGVVYFDELVTYYETDDAVPENAILATNLLADKTQLNAEIALEIAEQGDYTADSFNTYTEKLNQAKALVADVAVAQSTVDQALNELKNARLNLAVRSVEEVEGGKRSFRLISGNSVEVVLANYVEENGLSSISYTVQCDSANVTLSQIADGKFSITAGQVDEAIHATVTIAVLYKGEQQLAVQLDVEITNDIAPVLRSQEIATEHDVFELDDKQQMLLDLSENVDNVGNLQLTYSAKIGENDLAVDGAVCTFVLGAYGDSITYETIAVTVSFMANGEQQILTYTYKLGLKDTTANRLANGGFENGLEGWTVVGNIGNVDTATHYWLNDPESAVGFAFGMDGEKMFSAYAPGAQESAVGTLTSSTFTVGGSGFVTFKVGAMRDGNYVYVDVVDAETKQILVRYYNGLWAERTNDVKSGCTLVAYKADLSDFMGKQVFFRISDNADSGYGLFFADSFNTYYESEPEGFNVATPVDYAVSGTIYDLFNGGFEMGDVQGWWNNGEPGKVTNANAFFSGVEYGKDGEFLYSGVEDHGAGNGREGNTGVLTSSVFQLGGTGYISYMLGGGNEFCYVQVIDATTGEVLARFRQQAREDAVLKLYVADLSEHVGKTVRIQLVDNATSDWGCVSFDNVVTYHTSIPTGITAIDVKYEIANGSFESGMLGWKMNITEAGAHDTLGWVESSEHDAGWYTKNDGRKDGNNLFTFCRPDGTNCENSKGTLESTVFTLKQGAYVSFRFGGAGTRDVYVQLCNANGEVIATFFNEAEGKQNTEMFAYFYQYTGETADCFFRVVDNSTSNYGCFVVDDFRVNLESAPEGFLPAVQ
ncbi:MAG: FIVAR domain-containing protein, partial [Clostridia bacterium]|nr:FIVAR domain-containing protein [Clostridia bacterium]